MSFREVAEYLIMIHDVGRGDAHTYMLVMGVSPTTLFRTCSQSNEPRY